MQLGQTARFGGRSWVRSALTHGATATITGSGFGTKATAAPTKWDDCQGTNVSTLWSTVYPTTAGGLFDLQYITPASLGQGVSLPHTRGTKYMAGCHRFEDSADGGNFVGCATDYVASSYPHDSYWCCYWRADPGWVDNGGDANFKLYSVNDSATAGHFGNYWYYTYSVGDSVVDSSSQPNVEIHDSGNLGGASWDTLYGGQGANPINQWIKLEIVTRWARTSAGYFSVYEGGTNMIEESLITDSITGTSARSEFMGNYARARGTENYRYFKDIYFDRSWARVMLGNQSTLANSTIREPQICSAWSNTSITFTVNLGALTNQSAYLFVVDSSNAVAATFPVTVGV